jgi:hypothetical protein
MYRQSCPKESQHNNIQTEKPKISVFLLAEYLFLSITPAPSQIPNGYAILQPYNSQTNTFAQGRKAYPNSHTS